MVLKTNPVKINLLGHGLERLGSIRPEPEVTGTFARETVTGNDGREYAVFTISDPVDGAFPSQWAGTYRIDLTRLKNAHLGVNGQYNPNIFE